MSTTRTLLEARIRAFFENDNYYSTTDIVNSMQDGYDEVCALTGVILKSVVIPYIAKQTYYDLITLIPDFVGVFAIFNHSIKRWMLPSSTRKFNLDRPDWETAYGVPYYFSVISHRYMAIYKKPSVSDAGNMDIFYIARANQLTADSSVIQIPDEHLTALSEYIETDLWEQNQEWTKATSHLKSYVENCQELYHWAKQNRNHDRIPGLK